MKNSPYIRSQKKKYSGVFFMIFLAITAISLSFWQISRAVEKKNFIEKKSERGKEILSLNSEFTKINSLDAQNWDQRRIKVLGYWVPNTTIYLDNRSHNATSGVHALSALKLKENDSILWVNRGWGIKPPGFIEKSKKFIDGKKYLPYEIKDIVEIEGIAHIDLMKRIELTSDLSILRNGRLWQNIDWSSLYQLLESQKSLDFDIVWPFFHQ